MDAAAVYLENSRNGKRIVARESFRTSFPFTAILSYRKNKSLSCKPYSPKKSAANGRNIMPDNAACLDAGDAHHTFIPENSSQPAMKKQADRSNINADSMLRKASQPPESLILRLGRLPKLTHKIRYRAISSSTSMTSSRHSTNGTKTS